MYEGKDAKANVEVGIPFLGLSKAKAEAKSGFG